MKKLVLSLVTVATICGIGATSAHAETPTLEKDTLQAIAGPNGLVVRFETSGINVRSAATATRNGGRVGAQAWLTNSSGTPFGRSQWVDGHTQVTARSAWAIGHVVPRGAMR